LFPRTQLLSQASGVTAAATILHDDHIGVGQVFHLFRLPEDLEQSLHRILNEPGTQSRIAQMVSSPEAALEGLKKIGSVGVKAAAGPVRAGDLEELRDSTAWTTVAAIYADALESNAQSFPYFADQN